jgi:nucleoside-diphosphate-sugar epimerase
MSEGLVLVSGGAGFIGSHLIRALVDSGRRVLSLDTASPGPAAEEVVGDAAAAVTYLVADITDAESVVGLFTRHRPSEVVHIAAITNPVALRSDPLLALRVNVEGSVRLMRAAAEAGTRRFVQFSSIGALPAPLYRPVDTNHPVITAREGAGSGFYGAAKIAAEAFAFAFHANYGLDTRIIRPSAVYGLAMQWPIYIKPMVEGAVRGEPVRLETGGSFPRDYTHVRDVAGLTVAVLDGPDDADRLFYAATGQDLTTGAQLAEIVRQVVPGADIKIGDALSNDDLLEIKYRSRLSIDSARTQLGWEPTYRDLIAGVTEYAHSYRRFLECARQSS